eukprot:CAMPEP_0179432584 /NCGR_PEP_ID=MMETSP0799-20121207/17173_1 /TAXON_ID=46947 /ORGANISM="Geminigera cryophila, Strain CCMP2564" /LENGTH=186 /DNA_ID=CAMNT_0021210059 /DNA_START=225 /DNA_END=785 /DNA_ORIENTATION=+
MNLHRFSSSSSDGSAQLRTWISHTVPHMTLVSLTTDTVPGLWLFAAGCIGIASIVVIGRTLREVSAAQRLCSPAVELPEGNLDADVKFLPLQQGARAHTHDTDQPFRSSPTAAQSALGENCFGKNKRTEPVDDDYQPELLDESDDEWELPSTHDAIQNSQEARSPHGQNEDDSLLDLSASVVLVED